MKKKLKEVQKAKDHTEKAKEEVEKAQEEAKQHGYDVGVAETEDALRAEVLGVCRLYCAPVWDKVLNETRVEASSVLRRVESVYYPPAIHASSSSSTKPKVPPEVADPEKISPSKVPPSSGSPPKIAEQPGANEKMTEEIKVVASEVPRVRS